MESSPITADLSVDSATTYEEEYSSIRVDNASAIDQLLTRYDAVLLQMDGLSHRIERLLVDVTAKPAGLVQA